MMLWYYSTTLWLLLLLFFISYNKKIHIVIFKFIAEIQKHINIVKDAIGSVSDRL